jgi:hypothetical protein
MWVEFGWRSVSAAGEVAWVPADWVVHHRTKDTEGTISGRFTIV